MEKFLRKDGRYYKNNENGKQVLEKNKKIVSKSLTIDKRLFSGNVYEWLKSVKISCKKSSCSNYEYISYAHLIPYFGNYKIKQINKIMINEFTQELLNKSLAPKTVKDILTILHQIFRYNNIDISITMPKVLKKDIKILSKEEQKILEKSLSNNLNEETIGIYLSLYTGLRIGEICALKWKNIDLKSNIIRVEKTLIRVKNYDNKNKSKTIVVLDDPKSNSSIRNIPIPYFIIPILKQLQKDSGCFLLTGKEIYIEPRTYTNHFINIMKSINLDKFSFHSLRHTFATRCIENGCDPKTLSEILGHSNVKITLDRYVHPSFDNKVKMMNNLCPMISLL